MDKPVEIRAGRRGALEALLKVVSEARSTSPLLGVFKMKGSRMGLSNHFMLAPMFDVNLPQMMVFQCGRQVGKSVSLFTHSILQARLIKNFDTLFVQPRFDQIKKFSTNIADKMIGGAYYRDWLVDPSKEQSIQQKTLRNGNSLFFNHAFLDADRIRGVTANKCVLDECQDILYDLIPIITETMSADTQWGLHLFSGTPKTTDNTLNALHRQSSMAEWVIRCGCGKHNIPHTSHDAHAMMTPGGCCCAKCGRRLDVSTGEYVHSHPDRAEIFAGYHIPQIIHPLHANYERKWANLLRKRETYPEARFKNEILGEPADEGLKPLTEADLRRATNGLPGDLDSAAASRNKYDAMVVSVDWSGHGASLASTTVITAVGTVPGDDKLHCVYLERLKPTPPEEEAKRIVDVCRIMQAAYLAHDFSGAGMIREATLVHRNFPVDQIVPFQIVFAPVSKKVMYYYKPDKGGRACYNIDRTRSLMILFEYIKKGKVTLPDFDRNRDCLTDLLNIYQETRETPRGAQITLMVKIPGKTDDAAFSLNFACATIWHLRGRYPSLAGADVDDEDISLMDPHNINWRR